MPLRTPVRCLTGKTSAYGVGLITRPIEMLFPTLSRAPVTAHATVSARVRHLPGTGTLRGPLPRTGPRRRCVELDVRTDAGSPPVRGSRGSAAPSEGGSGQQDHRAAH